MKGAETVILMVNAIPKKYIRKIPVMEGLNRYQLHYKSLGYSILHLIFHMNFHSLEFIIYNLNLISIS